MAIAASLVIFSPNFAQSSDLLDSLNDPAPQGTAVNWSGIWVGAMGGYQFSNSELDFDYDDAGSGDSVERWQTIDAAINGLGMEGFLGEAQIGYDQQVSDRLLIGLFAGYGINNAEFEAGFASDSDLAYLQDSGSISYSQDWHGVLGARVGLIKSPDTMFYGAGGWAFGKLDAISLTDSTGTTEKFDPEDKDLSGWFVELGAEHRLAGNIYGTFSGRYTSYGSNTLVSGDECIYGPDPCSFSLDVEKDDLAVMVGLKAKFGGF
jgi:opacity protein-like surface antigen